MNSISEVLSKAADLIEQRGWTQGTLYRDSDGNEVSASCPDKACFCAAGALVEVGGCWSKAWSFLDDLLPKSPDLNPTAAFNDAPGRTAEEVVAKLREAATLARDPGSAE